MTTELICADFKSKSRKYTKRSIEQPEDLNSLAVQIFNTAFPSVYGFGDGIDGVYLAPEKDPA